MKPIEISINNLKRTLNSKSLDIKKIRDYVNQIKEYKDKQKIEYLDALMYPEKCKGIKLPSRIPIPSVAFQLHSSWTFKLSNKGSYGDMLGYFNPYFLASERALGRYPSAVIPPPAGYNLNEYDVGNVGTFGSISDGDGEKYYGIIYFRDAKQVIPDVYTQYRLVSASIQMRYIGSMESAQGYMAGCVVNKENPYVMGTYPSLFCDNTFQNLHVKDYMNEPTYREVSLLEGLRMLYYPIDNTYEEFLPIFDGEGCDVVYANSANNYWRGMINVPPKSIRSGFRWMLYCYGPPLGDMKIDIYCNFECIPNSKFLNYMPIDINTIHVDSKSKHKVYEEVQKKAVQKLNKIK